jgi:hypothetical protein
VPAPPPAPPAPPADGAAGVGAVALPTSGGSASSARVTARVLGLRLCFPSGYDKAKRYLGVEVEVVNRSAGGIVVSSSSALLLDSDGRSYPMKRFSGEGLYTPPNECGPDLVPAHGVMHITRVLKPGEKQRGFVHDFPVVPGARGFRVTIETFTETEWKGAASAARPETIEIPVGDTQPVP